jgi:hypothetical protein
VIDKNEFWQAFFQKTGKRVDRMNINSVAVLALMTSLMGCGGNPLNNALIYPAPATPEPVDPNNPTAPIIVSSPVVVPQALAFNLRNARVIPGTNGAPDTLLVAISALDTTPINATWRRRSNLDIAGYQAFLMQENSLNRLFIGLADSSEDGSASAVLASDGGQFNKYFSGTLYERTGGYTPPNATGPGPATGQVSYKGRYVGMLNGGAAQLMRLPSQSHATVLHQKCLAKRPG